MIKVFATQTNLSSWEQELNIHLSKDGVKLELNDEEFKELLAVIHGKRKVMTSMPKDGEYNSEHIYLTNY